MFKQFENAFRWCDYIFKFVGWNVLMGLLIYVGREYHRPFLGVMGHTLSVVSSVALTAFFGDLIEQTIILRFFPNRKVGAAVFLMIFLVLLIPLVLLQMQFLNQMVSFADRK